MGGWVVLGCMIGSLFREEKPLYARTVTVDLNPELWEEALAFGNSVRDQIAGFPGLKSWMLVANRETGKGTSFTVFENEEAFRSVNDQINKILSDFGQFFTAPPNEILGDVLVYVEN